VVLDNDENLLFCTKIMKKIFWTDGVKRKEPLQRVKENRNMLNKIKREKAKWIHR